MLLRLVLTFLSFLVLSCAGTKEYVNGMEQLDIVDFREWTKEGFHITTADPDGSYEPVAMLEYCLMPEANYRAVDIPNPSFDPDSNKKQTPMYTVKTWIWESINIQDCIDTIVRHSKEMGANSIYNFKTEYFKDNQHKLGKNYPDVLEGVKVSGFAIKTIEE
ncbi:MAG TPA: hypothetical protein VJ951_13460 [Bacteroidales bacterium]|nr:hypothetical protein [Bacteroidales bacterium]